MNDNSNHPSNNHQFSLTTSSEQPEKSDSSAPTDLSRRIHDLRGIREGLRTIAKLMQNGFDFSSEPEGLLVQKSVQTYLTILDSELAELEKQRNN